MSIKAGVIGLGVGEAHINGYQSHPECEVVAICDFKKEKLKEVSEKHPEVTITTDANEILTDPAIDVVSIASYDNFHFEQIDKGLDYGKHLFIEKPICLFESEAKRILDKLQGRPEIKISSNLILRKSERFSDLKKRIENRKLGDIYYVKGAYNYGRIKKITEGWRGKIDFYSVIYGGGVHLIDLIQWMLKGKITEVATFANRIATNGSSFKNFDFTSSILRFDNEVTASLNCNFGCVHPHFHQFEVYGTEATFINQPNHAEWFINRNASSREIIKTKYPGVQKGDLIHDFIDAILQDRSPEVSLEDIFSVMSICFALEKSAHSGDVEEVNYLI